MVKLYKMLALIQNENMKIYRRARTWVMVGLIIAVLLLMAILLSTVPETTMPMIDFMSTAVNVVVLATIFTVVIASDSVASEFSWGTIKLLLIRPTKRWKILLSKFLASLLFALFLLLVLFLVSWLLGLLFFDTGKAAEDSITMSSITQRYGFEAIALLMVVSFSFMISSVFRSSVLAIVLSMIILFAGGSVTGILMALDQEWGKYLLFSNLDLSIYMGDAVSTPFPDMTLAFSLGILIAHFIFFHAVAFWLFIKRDVSF